MSLALHVSIPELKLEMQPQVRNTEHERLKFILQGDYDLKSYGKRWGGGGMIA